jgi:hypothetical protein
MAPAGYLTFSLMNRETDLSPTAIWDFYRQRDLAASESAEMLGAHKSQISRWEPVGGRSRHGWKGFYYASTGGVRARRPHPAGQTLTATSHKPGNRGIAKAMSLGACSLRSSVGAIPGRNRPWKAGCYFPGSYSPCQKPHCAASRRVSHLLYSVTGRRCRSTCKSIEDPGGLCPPDPLGVIALKDSRGAGMKKGRAFASPPPPSSSRLGAPIAPQRCRIPGRAEAIVAGPSLSHKEGYGRFNLKAALGKRPRLSVSGTQGMGKGMKKGQSHQELEITVI